MGDKNLDELLDPAEMQRPRQPREFHSWVIQTLNALGATPAGKSYLRLGRGYAKQLVEELYPLAVLVSKLHSERDDLLCVPVLGNQNYDAVLRTESDSNEAEEKIEITQASTDYSTHLRMLHLEEHGRAPGLGTIRRQEGKVVAETAAAGELALVNDMLDGIAEAAMRKSEKSYGKDTSLLIFCEDSAYCEEADQERFDQFVAERLCAMPLDFATVHFVGAHGRLFESVSLD